jgi:histidyl-tRNA synthetase
MRVQKSKGTRDLLPAEMLRFRAIKSAFRSTCAAWDYQEIRTPTIEYLHLFTSTGTLTPGTLGKVYSFLDWDGWSGERVVLRPDCTIPVARLYVDNLSKQETARLYYVTNIFRFEETGKEDRERWQCGAELIGAGAPASDVELITVALETLGKLKLDNVTLKLSHAGVIRALLTGFGLSPEEQGKVFDQILDGDVAVLAKLSHSMPELVRLLKPLLDLKGESSGFLKNLRAVFKRTLPQFAPALDNFIAVADLLTTLGYKYEIDISSGRGFEYYTGLIFQLFVNDVKAGGGGRYDALIPQMGGPDIPACGFAIYADPLMNMIKTPPAKAKRVIVTAPEGTAIAATAIEIVRQLHEAGVIAALGTGKEKDAAWQLAVRAKSPRFVLSGKSVTDPIEVKTIGEVLKLLGAGR